MNLHEYQGKEILKKYGVKIGEGICVETPEQAVEAAQKLKENTGTQIWVIKAQIHAGGRGKGKIKGTDYRGVMIAKTLEEVKEKASQILGGTLVTVQTGPEGKKVNKVLVAADVYYSGATEPQKY